MLEKTVERGLVAGARKRGGLALKWVSPSMAGVPDRIVFLPGGRVVFVEVKAPGKMVSAIQARVIAQLRELGAEVRILDSLEGVDAIFA